MTDYLMKKDRPKLEAVAKRLRQRRGGGGLYIFTCDSSELEPSLIDGLKRILKKDFEIRDEVYDLEHSLLGHLPAFDPEAPVLHVFHGFPHDRLKGGRHAEALADNLNLARNNIQNRNLHCVCIMPRAVENILMLKAADLFSVRKSSSHFADDLVPVKRSPIIKDPKLFMEITRLEETIPKIANPIVKANQILDLSRARMSADDKRLAEKHLKQAEKLYKRQKFEEGLINTEEMRLLLLGREGKYREALKGQLKLQAHYKQQGNQNAWLETTKVIASYYHLLGQYRKAKVTLAQIDGLVQKKDLGEYERLCYQSQVFIDENLDYDREEHVYQSLGGKKGNFAALLSVYYRHKGNLEKAQLWNKRSNTLGMKNPHAAQCLLLLAGEFKLAEKLLKSLVLEPKSNLISTIINQHIALYHLALEQTQAALAPSKKSMSSAEKIENAWEIQEAKVTHGEVLIANERYDDAERHLQDLETNWGEGPVFLEPMLHRLLAMLYTRTERHELALAELEKSFEICQRCGYRPEEGYAHRVRGEVYRRQGDFERAYDELKRAYDLLRDFDIPCEARILKELAEVVDAMPDKKEPHWRKRAIKLYEALELPNPPS